MNAWTDAVDERDAARCLDEVRYRPARPDVVDHRRAWLLVESGLRKQRRDEVAGNELPRLVDEEAAVRVAVEGDAEIGPLLGHLPDDELTVLGQERVRLVVGKRAVGLEVAAHGLDRKSIQERQQHRPCHPVGRVDDDPQWPDARDVDEREHPLGPARVDVPLARLPATVDCFESAERPLADLEQARVAAHRAGTATHDLHPRVLLRVVRRGDGDPAVEAKLADGVVEHLGADHPDVDDVGAAVERSAQDGCSHRGSMRAHVASDGDRLRLELLDEPPADAVGALLVKLGRVDPSHVICLEDRGLERHRSILGVVPPGGRVEGGSTPGAVAGIHEVPASMR